VSTPRNGVVVLSSYGQASARIAIHKIARQAKKELERAPREQTDPSKLDKVPLMAPRQKRQEVGLMKPATLARTALFLNAALILIPSAHAHLGHPLDDAQCSAVWAKASPNGDAISWNEAGSYIPTFMTADSNQDGMISAEEFKQACAEGRVIHLEQAPTTGGGK
jgi:hypothetical protein